MTVVGLQQSEQFGFARLGPCSPSAAVVVCSSGWVQLSEWFALAKVTREVKTGRRGSAAQSQFGVVEADHPHFSQTQRIPNVVALPQAACPQGEEIQQK